MHTCVSVYAVYICIFVHGHPLSACMCMGMWCMCEYVNMVIYFVRVCVCESV